jgi:hypothetical protein
VYIARSNCIYEGSVAASGLAKKRDRQVETMDRLLENWKKVAFGHAGCISA